MKNDKMIFEAIDLIEQRGEDGIKEVNRNMKQWEYSRDLDEIRKAEKILNKLEKKHGRSPEEILIEREEREKIVHFLLWVRDLIKAKDPIDWDIFKSHVVNGTKVRDLAKKYGYSEDGIRQKIARAIRLVEEMEPYYAEQYGGIKEYLQN